MYYGNPSASSSSNGDATFEFFDDFSGDLAKWTIPSGTIAAIENGEVSIVDTPNNEAFIHSKTFQTKNGIIEARIKVISTTSVAHWIIDGRWTSPSSHVSVTARQGSGYNDFYIYDSPIHTNSIEWTTNKLNQWFLFQLKMNENSLEGNVYDMDGTLLKSLQGPSSKGTGFVGIRSWGSSHTYYDDVRVRKYASSEPTISLAPANVTSVPSPIITPFQTSSPECPTSSAVLLHGEKTDVVLSEDILLKLSAVNLITKPPMSVQVMIYTPSGMSVTSSEFIKSGAGIYTTTYTLNPGDGKDIEVHIKSNQVGDFNAKGRIVYYFSEDKDKAEDCTLNLPIKVRAPTPTPTNAGFEAIIIISSILLVYLLRKKW